MVDKTKIWLDEILNLFYCMARSFDNSGKLCNHTIQSYSKVHKHDKDKV